MKRCTCFLALALALSLPALSQAQLKAKAGEWPGWRGANRDGRSTETGLLKEWPSGGPKLAWKIDSLGEGFSTPSVAEGKIFILGTKERKEHLIALDVKNGKEIWSTHIGEMTGGHPGPRSTPTIDEGYAYVISSNGNLVCADTKEGKIVWQKNLPKDFKGRRGGWAYTESPLIDGDAVICTPGGNEAALIALKKKSGEPIWKCSIDLQAQPKGKKRRRPRSYSTAGYSSIIVAEMDGAKQYIQFLSGGVVGVDAKTGKLLWNYDAPANRTANCSTPVFHEGSVFAASAYGNGGGLAKISKDGTDYKASEVYFLKEMQSHHGGFVRVGDHIYGTNGRELLCIEMKSGKIVWKNRSVGKGSIVYADGHLYVRSERGPVALVEANPKEYVEKGRFDQPERSRKRAWPYPIVAGGKLYLRDQENLFCYDVKK